MDPRRRSFAGALTAVGLLGVSAVSADAGAEDGTVIAIHESHHEVLPTWLAAIEAGSLQAPTRVLHFDAHPDLAAPTAQPTPADPMAGVDIASFQLAAVFLGAVDRVDWLHPSWTFQLPDGEYAIRVGRSGARLRVDATFDYYVLDDGWAPTETLEAARTLRLRVVPLDAAIAPLAEEGDWILDIDLDGFGTRNPGADALRLAGADEDSLARLRRVFGPTRLDLPEDPAARVEALDRLMKSAERAAGGGIASIAGVFELWQSGIALADLGWLAWVLAFEIEPGEFVAEHGRTAVALPEYNPTQEEIEATAAELAALIARSPRRPALVTVARSQTDGYTSRSVAIESERALLQALAPVLPEARVVFAPGLVPAPSP